MTGKEMVHLFLKNGWVLDHVTGSHHIMADGNKTVSIPVHNKAMKKGTEQKILKQGGFK